MPLEISALTALVVEANLASQRETGELSEFLTVMLIPHLAVRSSAEAIEILKTQSIDILVARQNTDADSLRQWTEPEFFGKRVLPMIFISARSHEKYPIELTPPNSRIQTLTEPVTVEDLHRALIHAFESI